MGGPPSEKRTTLHSIYGKYHLETATIDIETVSKTYSTKVDIGKQSQGSVAWLHASLRLL